MVTKLLVRTYDVGLGDCIYVRIPHGTRGFHILIDCGSWSGSKKLGEALAHLKGELPQAQGKRQLDLLVATHLHFDHLSGFKKKLFEGIKVKHLWLSAAMNEDHPQATGLHQLHDEVNTGLTRLQKLVDQGLPLSDDLKKEIEARVELAANEEEMDLLLNDLGTTPVFVHAGDQTPVASLGLPPQTKLTILAPENNIDYYYMGDDGAGPGVAPSGVSALNALSKQFAAKKANREPKIPANISAADFRNLQTRLLSNILAFSYAENGFTNNTSVVFILEWKGKRLLFAGDAEWDAEYKDGKANGSWNVMWHKYKPAFTKPLDFLKISHHGSINATPWNTEDPSHEASQILDAILPRPTGGKKSKARALISTERGRYETIPGTDLVKELGARVANTKVYKDLLKPEHKARWKHKALEERTLGFPQPLRTDFERLLKPDKNYIELEF